MNPVRLQAVKGMNDVLPEVAETWEALETRLRDWLRAYGYRPIRTPLLEPSALFVRAIGEATDIVEKEMYSFTDALNGEALTLRPEGTAACVRAVLEHNLLYDGPKRLWYMGPMFRHEKPQQGRYRQFHQLGVEALGFTGPDVDAEQIVMVARLWRMLDLPIAADGVMLEVNSLGEAEERQQHRQALTAYLQQHSADLDESARRRLHTNPLRILDSKNPQMQALIEAAPQLSDYLGEASRQHFDSVLAQLRAQQIPYRINPRLVRGLDYYNRTVFEWVTRHLGAQGTVCAGGRYDGLIQQLGGKPAPACGFALGLERLLALCAAYHPHAPLSTCPGPQVYLVHQGETAGPYAFALAEMLRDAGIETLYHCGGGSFKVQMRRADASGARWAVIIGDDEVAQQEVSIKPLRLAQAQQRVARDQLVATITHWLQETNDGNL